MGAQVGVGVNHTTNLIYVSNANNDNVSVIDGSTNSVIKTVSVGDSPRGIGVNPTTNLIYVSNTLSGDVTVIRDDGGDGDDGIVFESLLKKYAPILYLDETDFYPTKIDAMLDKSVLNTGGFFSFFLGGKVDSPTIDDLMKNNRNNAFLDLKNASPGLTKRNSIVPEKTRWDTLSYPPTVYGREFKQEDLQLTFLQYWFFYVFNDYTDFNITVPPISIQRHEGDWEMIQIILNKDDSPITSTYSYHRGGIRHSWDELEFDEIIDPDKNHPKVFVARGGHGSWSTAGEHKWFQDLSPIPLITACNFGDFTDVTTDNEKIIFPNSIAPLGESEYELIDISKDAESDNHWTHWQGKWGDVLVRRDDTPLDDGALLRQQLNKILGIAGPDSPANIKFKDAPKRWNEPFQWAASPQPSTYIACLDPEAVALVFNPQGDLVDSLKSGSSVLIFSDEDLTFEIHSTTDNQVNFSISRYSRKDKKSTTVRYKDIYLSTKDKAVLSFTISNPELQLSIERNNSRTISEWIRPHLLDIRSKKDIETR